jgi:hypothetical protein
MSRASRERHRRFFTLERMLDETAAVFERVAGNDRLGRVEAGEQRADRVEVS